MPNVQMQTSLHGHRIGLGPNNELIVNQEKAGGLRDAVHLSWSIARGQLSSAEILALNGTPIEVIAAPGAGYAIIVDHAEFFLDYGTATYDEGAGEDLVLTYTDGSGIEVINPVDGADFLGLAADAFAYSAGHVQADVQGFIPTANAAIVAFMKSGEVITGDGVVNYAVYYRRIATTLPAS